ncbi:MAG: hypothetical protein IPK15_27355 [Verrucomicrobia bacterium]|nr:hypothetical protein [Verrucomicrobiota bacterium]
MLLFVTSRGTFDKQDEALREYLAQQADLLGADSPTNDAFKKNANTEVTSDIMMLRKRLPGEASKGPAWKSIVESTNTVDEVIAPQRILRRKS